jgi:hypothetical protein
MRNSLWVLTLLASSSASATTITFEEFPATFGYKQVESGGYSVSASGSFEIFNLGANKILSMYATNTITIDSLSGDNFAIGSLDLWGYAGSSVSLIGLLTGGGTIQNTVNFTATGLRTVALDSSWNNLESFQVQLLPTSGGQNGIDDIVISTVPVPATVWLFGSALVVLGWLRRKQIA